MDGAISEYREALKFAPQNNLVMSRLAPLLEKKGDAKGALEQYRQAAEIAKDQESRTAYSDAQKRLGAQLVAIQPAKKSAKPASRPHPAVPAAQLESAWREALADGDELMAQGKQREAIEQLQYAVSLAEKLTPQDERLLNSVFRLGLDYLQQRRLDEGKAVMERMLALGEQIYGPQSRQITPTLQTLADVDAYQKDYATAETLYMRALELNEKFLGADHTVVAANLSQLGKLYKEEKAFDKAEPMFLRALAISESLSPGGDDLVMAHYVIQVQDLYVSWGKFDKAEPYACRILSMNERVYGPNSRMVLTELQTLIDILSKLGKTEEADNLRNRSAAISNAQPASKP